MTAALAAPRLLLAGALLAGTGSAATIVSILPMSRDFGHTVVRAPNAQGFTVVFSTPNQADSLRTGIAGPDAADFSISSAPAPAPGTSRIFPASTCLLALPRLPKGACDYVVIFTPSSLGRKHAILEITEENGYGKTFQVMLEGEGVFGCRAYLVPCNYVEFYEGTISVSTVLATAGANPNRTGRWLTNVTVTIRQGAVVCTVGRNDMEQESSGGKPLRKSTESGLITGPGLAAIEFRKAGSDFEYTLKYACPEPATTGTFIDYVANESGATHTPGIPLQWTGELVIDPQRVAAIGDSLGGRQESPHDNAGANDDVQGGTTTTWSLRRWL